ncbi:hypothetical protein C2S51_038886 [Perilla frutescens var. frutescens]|nr:hypothetical protein C2S51_038886 [Perilla frutescens var. frutescens]
MFMEEGKLYAIKNFVVANNFMRYKTTNSKYKLLMYKQTEIFELFVENFPRVMFNFKPFEDIHSIDNIQSAELFDVIGVIVSTSKPQGKEVNGKSTKLMDFIIEDLEKKTLSCTLWDTYADQLYNFLIKYPEDPVIVVLQYCRPTAYKGEIKVTNAYHATKVIFDENMTEIKEFKEEFEKGGKTTPTSITDLTLVDATKRNDNNSDFDTEFKPLSHLQTDGKAGELDELPVEIESLVGKKALFMVNVKDGETKDFKGAYGIMKVTCDPEMIKKYCELYAADNQGTDPISELNDIENPTAEIGSSRETAKASSTDSHKKKIHFMDVNDDETSTSTNDSHMKTGDSIGLNDDDTLNKTLTNVRNKKCRKVVKKE